MAGACHSSSDLGKFRAALVCLRTTRATQRNQRREFTFVAKMAAPVGVAQALPGLHAGAVYAAGVGDALVTVLALPAIQTTVRHTESHAQNDHRHGDPTPQQNVQKHSSKIIAEKLPPKRPQARIDKLRGI